MLCLYSVICTCFLDLDIILHGYVISTLLCCMINDRIAVVVGAREAGYALCQSVTSLSPMCWLGWASSCVRNSEYYMLTSIIAKKKNYKIDDTYIRTRTRPSIHYSWQFLPNHESKIFNCIFPRIVASSFHACEGWMCSVMVSMILCCTFGFSISPQSFKFFSSFLVCRS